MIKAKAGFAIVLTMVLALAGVGFTASAQQAGPIQVLNQSVTSNYPNSLNFHLEAQSTAGDITSIRLSVRFGVEGSFLSNRIEDFTPGQLVVLDYEHDTFDVTLPPFVPVDYRWQIVDSAGNTLETDTYHTEYVDNTRAWNRLENEYVAVYWYGYDLAFGSAILSIASDAYLRLERFFGVSLEFKPRVLVFSSRDDFSVYHAGGEEDPNIGGQYYRGLGVTANIIEPGDPRGWWDKLIPHELSHLFSDSYYSGFSALPSWLEEGLATYNELINRDQNLYLVQHAAATGEIIPMIDLERTIYDDDVNISILSYAESSTIIRFIAERWGEPGLQAFLAAFRESSDVDSNMRAVLGVDMTTFELMWRAWLGYPVESVPTLIPTPTFIIRPSPTPWSPAPGAAVTPTPIPTPTSSFMGGGSKQ